MIENRNVHKIHLKEDLNVIAAEGSSQIIQSVQAADALTPTVLSSASETVQSILCDRMLSEEFLGKIDSRAQDDNFRRRTAFEFRALLIPLQIPFPEPVLEMRSRSWAYTGCLGALLGMLSGGPLLHYLLDMRDAGVILGGAAGSLVFLMLVGYLVQHPRILRVVQGAFGAATILEVATMAGASINPLSLLWGRVTKYFTGRGLLHRIKRIGVYLAGILVLQLAVPRARIRWDQLESNTRDAVQSWLSYHLNILLLLHQKTTALPGDTESHNSALPAPLISSIQKLSLAPTDQRSAVAEEVIQEYKNSGFSTFHDESGGTFENSLYEQYEILGLIEQGDPFRILEHPVIKDGQVIKKGRLTKQRG